DRALAEHLLAQTGLTVDDAGDRARLLAQARAVKEQLSAIETVAGELDFMRVRGRFSVDRAEFDSLTAPLLARALAATRRTLRDAHVHADEIDGVVLV
ncbi:MAG: Hsp70 family protein, partial [Burkholderiaceae bacterium]|nr:Hsp70 family protein [Burkholderiaceae bacterium]